jgi:tetratricopeptide (TPR) repeat protein
MRVVCLTFLVLATVAVGFPAAAHADSTPGCVQGDVLRVNGQSALAARVYARALRTPDGLACAIQGLKRLKPAAPPSACDRGDALRANHAEDEAKAAYAEGVNADPKSSCAIDGLDALHTPVDRIEAATTDLGTILGFAALCIAGLVILFLVFVVIPLTRWSKTRDHRPFLTWRRPKLQIGSFDGGSISPIDGDSFVGLLRTDLLRPPDFGEQVDVVTAEAAGEDALDGLAGALPDAGKAAAALLKALRRLASRPTLLLAGALQPQGHLGYGTSVALAGDAHYTSAADLWATTMQIPPSASVPDTFGLLSLGAGGYARHAYTQSYLRDPLMGSSAAAWAQFRVAQEWFAIGNHEAAIAVCQSAMQLDRSSPLLRGLLGQLYLQTDTEVDKGQALLIEAIEEIEEIGSA